MKFRYLITAALLLLNLGPSQAMDLVIDANRVFASGPIGEDLRKFEEALAKPEVDTIVFLDSPGGDLWTGLRVGRLIADKKMKTIIGGRCVSACSLMFLGGTERTFSDVAAGSATSIGIHGAHNRLTGSINPEVQTLIFAFMKLRLGEKLNPSLMNQALYEMDDRSALLTVFDKKRASNSLTIHCRSAQVPREKCTTYPEETALSLGLITSEETSQIELPPSLKKPPQLLGVPLTVKIANFDAFVKDLMPQHCETDKCKDIFASHPSKGRHKALALPSSGFGLANSWDVRNEFSAVAAATYSCNHRKDRPTLLCQVVALDDFDLRSWHAAAAQSHTDALSKLEVPSQTTFADESKGGEYARFNGIRSKYLFEMTPNTVPSVKTFSTAEVASGLKAKESAPVLIDVDVAEKTIPNSLALINAGYAYENPNDDAAAEVKYKGLMQLLAPDLERPLIFFGRSKETWTPVNAALRALKLGYKNVGWYRGGMKAWEAASLPVATPVLNAVVQ